MTISGRNAGVAAEFLAEVAEPAVRDHLSGSQELAEFLRSAGTLTAAERKLLVEQALVLLEQNYVHLPLKMAMHACNPVQRLRLLRLRLERQGTGQLDPEWAFHTELSEIFHSVRDLHTNYLLPDPFAGKVAYLPFQVEEYFDDSGGARYVVSRVVQGFAAEGFGRGADVTHWSGIPIARAIERNGARFAGSNAAARHARGLGTLTVRPLVMHLPPDEEWVTVGYVGTDGVGRELRQKWLVVENLPPFVGDVAEISSAAAAQGLDLDGDEAGRARLLLFAPSVAGAVLADEAAEVTATPAAAGDTVPSTMPQVFKARSVVTQSGTFAHVRVYSFNVQDPDGFVAEFVRLIGLLPQDGLILDVRDNGGGHILAGELALQTLTPRRIVPEPVQFIATPLTTRICRKHRDDPTGQIDLGAWFPSLDQAAETGSPYSGAFSITPEDGANAIGQRYQGPVVLITNARCYSATDMFAAGFADHNIGRILGVDDNTGAGGANVWRHGLLRSLLAGDPGSPYAALPKGADMRVAIRRTLRVGKIAGTPVEDLGIVPDERHRMTRRDVLEDNIDLLEHAGRMLVAQPSRTLGITVRRAAAGSGLTIDIRGAGVDRADIYLDGRPRASADMIDGAASVTVEGVPGTRRVRAEGFAGGVLVTTTDQDVEAGEGVARTSVRQSGLGAAGTSPTVIYLHGAGNKPPRDALKRAWDQDLFERDMATRTRMAYYADVLFPQPASIGADACTLGEALGGLLGVSAATEADVVGSARDVEAALSAEQAQLLLNLPARGQRFAAALAIEIATRSANQPPPKDLTIAALPLPPDLRRLILQQLLQLLIPDAAAYFFGPQRGAVQDRFRQALDAVSGPVVVVSHSLGTVIAYDVLSEPRFAGRVVPLLVTAGSPLGYTEIQDVVTKPLRIPSPVGQWANFADQLDVITLDTTLSDDFGRDPRITDTAVDNRAPNNHAACGYLRTAQLRARVTAALA
jgi:peptidase S41-like protein